MTIKGRVISKFERPSRTMECVFNITHYMSIAIVGNGPLTDEQRNEINEYEIIIRQNYCNNFKKGDKTSHLLLRYSGRKRKFKGEKYIEHANEILLYSGQNEEHINSLKIQYPNKTFKIVQWKDCVKPRLKWSTGYIAFEYFKDYKNVHMYGYNWHHENHSIHPIRHEEKIIKQSDIIIHDTATYTLF